MITSQTVSALVHAFDDPSDGQALKSRELVLLLLEESASPFSRRQFTPGHITCSGLVLAPGGERLLLVHHRRLDRWLLPGGHVEPDDETVGNAGRREVIEETGAVLADGTSPLIGIDVHGIPGRKDQPYHLHHDLLFFFRAEADSCRVSHESRAVLWCGPDEFDRYDLPGNIRRAYSRVTRTTVPPTTR
jgi:8-oxo-dGTP pyrophosphatase MutT (NUDIX family)